MQTTLPHDYLMPPTVDNNEPGYAYDPTAEDPLVSLHAHCEFLLRHNLSLDLERLLQRTDRVEIPLALLRLHTINAMQKCQPEMAQLFFGWILEKCPELSPAECKEEDTPLQKILAGLQETLPKPDSTQKSAWTALQLEIIQLFYSVGVLMRSEAVKQRKATLSVEIKKIISEMSNQIARFILLPGFTLKEQQNKQENNVEALHAPKLIEIRKQKDGTMQVYRQSFFDHPEDYQHRHLHTLRGLIASDGITTHPEDLYKTLDAGQFDLAHVILEKNPALLSFEARIACRRNLSGYFTYCWGKLAILHEKYGSYTQMTTHPSYRGLIHNLSALDHIILILCAPMSTAPQPEIKATLFIESVNNPMKKCIDEVVSAKNYDALARLHQTGSLHKLSWQDLEDIINKAAECNHLDAVDLLLDALTQGTWLTMVQSTDQDHRHRLFCQNTPVRIVYALIGFMEKFEAHSEYRKHLAMLQNILPTLSPLAYAPNATTLPSHQTAAYLTPPATPAHNEAFNAFKKALTSNPIYARKILVESMISEKQFPTLLAYTTLCLEALDLELNRAYRGHSYESLVDSSAFQVLLQRAHILTELRRDLKYPDDLIKDRLAHYREYIQAQAAQIDGLLSISSSNKDLKKMPKKSPKKNPQHVKTTQTPEMKAHMQAKIPKHNKAYALIENPKKTTQQVIEALQLRFQKINTRYLSTSPARMPVAEMQKAISDILAPEGYTPLLILAVQEGRHPLVNEFLRDPSVDLTVSWESKPLLEWMLKSNDAEEYCKMLFYPTLHVNGTLLSCPVVNLSQASSRGGDHTIWDLLVEKGFDRAISHSQYVEEPEGSTHALEEHIRFLTQHGLLKQLQALKDAGHFSKLSIHHFKPYAIEAISSMASNIIQFWFDHITQGCWFQFYSTETTLENRHAFWKGLKMKMPSSLPVQTLQLFANLGQTTVTPSWKQRICLQSDVQQRALTTLSVKVLKIIDVSSQPNDIPPSDSNSECKVEDTLVVSPVSSFLTYSVRRQDKDDIDLISVDYTKHPEYLDHPLMLLSKRLVEAGGFTENPEDLEQAINGNQRDLIEAMVEKNPTLVSFKTIETILSKGQYAPLQVLLPFGAFCFSCQEHQQLKSLILQRLDIVWQAIQQAYVHSSMQGPAFFYTPAYTTQYNQVLQLEKFYSLLEENTEKTPHYWSSLARILNKIQQLRTDLGLSQTTPIVEDLATQIYVYLDLSRQKQQYTDRAFSKLSAMPSESLEILTSTEASTRIPALPQAPIQSHASCQTETMPDVGISIIADLQEELETSQQALKALQQQIDVLQSLLEQEQLKTRQLVNQTEKAQRNQNTKIQNLKNEIAGLKQKLSCLEEQKSSFTSEIDCQTEVSTQDHTSQTDSAPAHSSTECQTDPQPRGCDSACQTLPVADPYVLMLEARVNTLIADLNAAECRNRAYAAVLGTHPDYIYTAVKDPTTGHTLLVPHSTTPAFHHSARGHQTSIPLRHAP